ncbi:MAG TPA: DUF4175 family protein [Acetobacteraceae bacterium]|nr:DUF4175 family protein [Acetobacteraceae bacterium]
MAVSDHTLNPAEQHFLGRLARRRRTARAVLWFERLWPALWPGLGVAGAFLCVALLALPQRLPAPLHLALLVVVGIAIAGLLWRGLAGLERPDAASVDRRLEASSGLAHQPLATIADRPAVADAAGAALWRAHVARARARLGRLRVGVPRPGLAARDRMALRGGLIVALIACLAIAGPDAAGRIGAALSTRLPVLPPGAPGTEVQAWITPPGYTGLPPVFLHAGTDRVAVPEGSHLTVSVTGGEGGAPLLSFGGAGGGFRALDAASWQADQTLTASGRLAIRRRGRDLGAWMVEVIANTPPTVAFAAPPGQAPHGLLVRLPWTAHDQYGVTELRAELRLQGRPDAPPIVVPIPLPEGDARAPHGMALRDLTSHPWAGLPVTATLLAKNAPGLEGHSAAAGFTLPERRFTNPIARAIIAVRRELSLHPDAGAAADTALGAIPPASFAGDWGGFLNLAAIRALLREGPAPGVVDEAQARMWTLALHLEDHQADATARALEAARQALRRTLDRAERTGHLDQKQFDARLRALQEAIRKHLQALLRQAMRNGTETPFDANRRMMSEADINRMLQQMQQAAKAGRMADAEQQMAQLEQMLQALQNAQLSAGQPGQRNAQQRRGQQQMGALQDLVGREGGLLDRSEQRGGQGNNPNAPEPAPLAMPDGFPGQPLPPAGAQAQAQAQAHSGRQGGAKQQAGARAADARTQGALRRALGELMQEFGDLTGKLPPALGDADQAMQRAGQALGHGQDPAAATAQKQAIAALSKGGQQMGQQMAAQFGASPGQGQQGQGMQIGQMGRDGQGGTLGMPGQGQGGDRRGPRDPLGRLTGEGNSGADEGNDVKIPTKSQQDRVREIEQELRRRDGQMSRPQQERDYIQRLLRTY